MGNINQIKVAEDSCISTADLKAAVEKRQSQLEAAGGGIINLGFGFLRRKLKEHPEAEPMLNAAERRTAECLDVPLSKKRGTLLPSFFSSTGFSAPLGSNPAQEEDEDKDKEIETPEHKAKRLKREQDRARFKATTDELREHLLATGAPKTPSYAIINGAGNRFRRDSDEYPERVLDSDTDAEVGCLEAVCRCLGLR